MTASRVVKNTAWLAFGEAAGRILRIILIIYSARVLGAGEWGISSYLLSWAALFTITTDLGLSAIVTRELVRDHSRRHEHLSAFFFAKLTLLIISTAIIIFAVPFMSALPLSRSLMISLALLVCFDSLRLIPTSINKARETMGRDAFANIITQSAILMIGTAALAIQPSAETLNAAYATGSFIGTVAAFLLVREWLPGIFRSFRGRLARELLRDSLPVAIVGLVGSLMLNTDIVMLGWMRTAEEIGYYSATQKIIFTLYVLPTLLASAAFPVMARLAHDAQAFKAFFEKTMKASLMAALPVTVGGLITAPYIIQLFYGAPYLPATTSYLILLLTVPIAFATPIINNALIAKNSQKYFLAYASIGLVSNAGLNYLLIPLWGINGAAIATLISETITGAFIWHKINRVSGFTVPHGLHKTAIACLALAGATYIAIATSLSVIAAIIMGTITYAGALLVLREPAFLELTEIRK